MFGFLKKNFQLVAPVSGKLVDLSKVPDEVFAQKLAGDGVAIESTGDIIVAPADGVLSLIFKTNHAFAMTLDNGAELLIHIGIDTVELQGEGFERLAEEGKRIKAGDPIVKVNREYITEKGLSLITPILITNSDNFKEITYKTDVDVTAGKDTILEYKAK